MCGRFTVAEPAAAIADALSVDEWPADFVVPAWNVGPGRRIPTVEKMANGRRRVRMRHWGMTLANGRLVINARSETMMEKRTFAPLLRGQRCLVPASGWFEWDRSEGRVVPHYFTRPDLAVLTLAALWRRGDGGVDEVVVVTEAAHPAIAHVHHRMPVILEPERAAIWLAEGALTGVPEAIGDSEAPTGWVVGNAVNKVVNDSPQNIVPVKPPPTQLSLF